jgi:hypothetical protein
MNGKNDISEELRSLSALVATINRESPYRAPDGYFLHFPEGMRQKVGATEVLPQAAKQLTFTVPEGYFEGFAQQILAKIKSTSGNSNTGAGHPADVEELSAVLVQAGRKTPYIVPEDYFDSLSPLLATLKDKNPYTVPAGYFDRFSNEMANEMGEKTEQQVTGSRQKAKVVNFGKAPNLLKYAAAAVVAGLIVTVGWLRWHTDTPSSGIAAAASSAQTPVEIAKNLSKVSDQELQSFLVDQDTTLAQPVTNDASMANIDMNDNDLKSLLGDVPDGELKQYMEEHEGATDIATN